jgi:Putative transposase of IS4/5 family (DUF4096)
MRLRVDARVEPGQPYGCVHVRTDLGVERVILEMQQTEAVALAVVGTPVVEGEELEIRHADRLFHPQRGGDLHRIAERHGARLSSRLMGVGGPLPFCVAQPRHAHHGIRVGRHERRERPDIAGQFEQGGESSGKPTGTREILNALFYVIRSGCLWRLLPKDFPPFTRVQNRFYAWRDC